MAGFVPGTVLVNDAGRPCRIGITAGDTSYVTVIEAVPRSRGAEVNGSAYFSGLRERAAGAGIRMGIEPGPDGTWFAWYVPLWTAEGSRPVTAGTNVPERRDSLPCSGSCAGLRLFFMRLTPGGGERGGAACPCQR
jgi:hypothetical protein